MAILRVSGTEFPGYEPSKRRLTHPNRTGKQETMRRTVGNGVANSTYFCLMPNNLGPFLRPVACDQRIVGHQANLPPLQYTPVSDVDHPSQLLSDQIIILLGCRTQGASANRFNLAANSGVCRAGDPHSVPGSSLGARIDQYPKSFLGDPRLQILQELLARQVKPASTAVNILRWICDRRTDFNVRKEPATDLFHTNRRRTHSDFVVIF